MVRRFACSALVCGALAVLPLSPAVAHDGHFRHGVGLGLVGAAIVGAVAVATAPLAALASPPPTYYAVPAYRTPVYVMPPAAYAVPPYGYPYGYYYRRY
ncbi:MAG TPA: hypothetical protein HPP80_04705 [Rhodospirillaceae bacterium]|nr:hypothetical protein [Rhodospirillaceae bacterium]